MDPSIEESVKEQRNASREDSSLRRTNSLRQPLVDMCRVKHLREGYATSRNSLSDGCDDYRDVSDRSLSLDTSDEPNSNMATAGSSFTLTDSINSLSEIKNEEAMFGEYEFDESKRTSYIRMSHSYNIHPIPVSPLRPQNDDYRKWPTSSEFGRNLQRSHSMVLLNKAAEESLECLAATVDARVASPPLMDMPSLSPLSTPPPRQNFKADNCQKAETVFDFRPRRSVSSGVYETTPTSPFRTCIKHSGSICLDNVSTLVEEKEEKMDRAHIRSSKSISLIKDESREASIEEKQDKVQCESIVRCQRKQGNKSEIAACNKSSGDGEHLKGSVRKTNPGPLSPEVILKNPPASLARDDSFECDDSEEFRDTVCGASIQLSLATQHLIVPADLRPKLKYQWSVDETREQSNSGGNIRVHNTEESIKAAQRPSEKRRLFFLRKQTNSAPDSFDAAAALGTRPKEHHSVSFCLGSVLRGRSSNDSNHQQTPSSQSSAVPPTIQRSHSWSP